MTSFDLYTAGMRLARILAPLASHGDGKLGTSVRGAIGSPERLLQWARAHRDPSRPLIWFHAPSVGEGLQAKAVMEEFGRLRPDAQLLYTHSSASAEAFGRTLPVAVADYLPPDLPEVLRPVLDALDPDAIVFTRSEVWPNLVTLAQSFRIPTALLSATLPAGSSRLRWPARDILTSAHARLSLIGAISTEDADRYSLLGVTGKRATVMGDARFDQVIERAARVDLARPELARLASLTGPVLVAGSTWPEDEASLIPALTHSPLSGLRLVLVPHEPSPAAIERIERALDSAKLSHARLGELEGGGSLPRVVLVDRVGILGDLYALGDVAYVGGGFGRAGLHSVLEPAAHGKPVLFGPHYSRSREAGELIEQGAAVSVSDGAGIAHQVKSWLESEAARLAAGEAARSYIEEGRGAAERGARLILTLLDNPG